MGVTMFWAAAEPAREAAQRTAVGFDNILRNEGLGIALTGMLIVFSALTLITVFIALMPKLLATFAFALPAEHHPPPPPKRSAPATDREKIAAVLGFVLHHRQSDNE